MIVVSGFVEVDPADHAKAAELMRTVAAATAAEEGSISYAFYADLETEGKFRVFEEWQDQAAIDAHFASDHMATFMASLGELAVKGTSIDRYEVSDKSKLM